jgi:glycosyltransferase involved in cell wall biosynthesis
MGMKVFIRDETNLIWSRPGPAKKFIRMRLLSLMRRVVSGILAIGTLNREYYAAAGFPPEKIFSMPYAVDNDWFRARIAEAAKRRDRFRHELGLEPRRPIALFAGKFIPRKRAQDLIRAFKTIAAEPAARRPYLLIAGDGEMNDELHAHAEGAPEGSIRFLGFRGQTELPPLYDISDVFVIPSDSEPWGLVTNEAMNAAIPVIATTEVGAARDLVRDGDNGFVVEPGDIEALAAALLKIFSDPGAAARMGERSLEIVGNWGFREDIDGLKAALRYYFGDRVPDGS